MGTIIAWTDQTWNPVTGCSRVSDGCKHCYAETLSLRRGWSQHPWTAHHETLNVVLHPERLRKPFGFKQPSRVFVNSMSDLFHRRVPDDYIRQVWDVMLALPQHTFQILTKRPERAATWPGPWAPNIWMGTSVEDERVAHRIDTIRQCGAVVRFLSCEPLIGPITSLDFSGLHWVIVGGESGPGYRPMDHAWARMIRDACVAQDVAFFFKQSANFHTERGAALIEVDGSATVWQQFPHVTLPQPVAVLDQLRLDVPA